MYKITNNKIEPGALFEWTLKPHHGAVVTFAGTVRADTDGRKTLQLEYEAYSEMAEAKMKEVGAELGGEGNGGVILPESHYGRDSLVGAALFLTSFTTAVGFLSLSITNIKILQALRFFNCI